MGTVPYVLSMAQADAFAQGAPAAPPSPLSPDGEAGHDEVFAIPARLAAGVCALIYAALTVVLGRHLLANLGSTVAHDAGDPLLTAAILKWNATHWPLSDAWWQFPIFHPTRDTMAFSEHLLGLSAVASPIYWFTRDTLVTANLATLLTYPLSALAMYALVFRLTRSVAGAFIAGLAFGFAPYRVSQLPHVQMLAAFWAPLALLGLHAYIETRRRRWLVLYGTTWMLQGAANGYALVFFSVLIALWVVWFVVLRWDWRACVGIAAATFVGAVPLVPILYEYIVVHARHGFERSLAEIQGFSADVSAVLCAPADLSLWGWLRVMCRSEGELFPGVCVIGLWAVAIARSLGRFSGMTAPGRSRVLTLLVRLLIIVGLIYSAIVVSVVLLGPWRIDWAFLKISTSSARKPALIAAACLVGVLLLSPFVRSTVRRSSTIGFYLLASVITWLMTLGPTITFMGVPSGYEGPFKWLLVLPGTTGLRVPARFWLMTMLCLSVVAGISVADLLRGRSRRLAAIVTLVVALGVLGDGWNGSIPAVAASSAIPGEELMRRATVLELPADGSFLDIAAVFRAVQGGWNTINGYSGWQPSYYFALIGASRDESSDVFTPFQRLGEVRVLVKSEATRLQALVERQPGARLVAQNTSLAQYRLPRLELTASEVAGQRIPIRELRSECSTTYLGAMKDGDEQTLWQCALTDERQPLIVDLGTTTTVSAIVHSIGKQFWLYPKAVEIETSEDGQTWLPARSGSVRHDVMIAGMRDAALLRVVLAFPPRPARYLRLRGTPGDPQFPWTIAELEVWPEARGIR